MSIDGSKQIPTPTIDGLVEDGIIFSSAYGSIRMEPVFMVPGRSAGTAAVLATDEAVAVQDISYDKLKAQLMKDGQIITLN